MTAVPDTPATPDSPATSARAAATAGTAVAGAPLGADLPAGTTCAIACVGVSKAYGDVQAVDGLDLTVGRGEIVALLGPSGCGKTTMLRLIAGFERADAGRISISGRAVVDAAAGIQVAPEARRLGMVFQDYALFPHLNVAKNVGYALGRRPDPARVAEVLELVGLADLGHRMPAELSGGQQQRVALARALAPEPAVVLLDEPFSGLDAALRAEVRGEVRDLLRLAGVSALLVTHDQDEALSVADRVAVMHDGRIEQIGTPEEVYLVPASRWVGAFLGEIDVLEGDARGGRVSTVLADIASPDLEGPVDVLVRPECVAVTRIGGSPAHDHASRQATGQAGGQAAGLGDRAAGKPGPVKAVVTERQYFGHDQLLVLALPDGATLRSRRLGQPTFRVGDEVVVALDGPVTILPRRAG